MGFLHASFLLRQGGRLAFICRGRPDSYKALIHLFKYVTATYLLQTHSGFAKLFLSEILLELIYHSFSLEMGL